MDQLEQVSKRLTDMTITKQKIEDKLKQKEERVNTLVAEVERLRAPVFKRRKYESKKITFLRLCRSISNTQHIFQYGHPSISAPRL